MAGHCEIPSFLATIGSLPFTPIVTMSLRLAFVVRSGLMTVQESPRSVDLNTRLAAASNTPGSFGEIIRGVSQWKRKLSPCAGAGVTLLAFGRMFLDSPVILFRRMMLPSCDSV